MNPSRSASMLTVGVLIVSLVATVIPARAQRATKAAAPNHDGVYAVHIFTERGACDKSYLWTIAVAGGRITSTGDTPMEATGEINPKGVVSLAFRRFNDIAHVAGKLKGRQGSGTWSSPTMACGGVWRAIRQS